MTAICEPQRAPDRRLVVALDGFSFDIPTAIQDFYLGGNVLRCATRHGDRANLHPPGVRLELQEDVSSYVDIEVHWFLRVVWEIREA